MRSAKMTVLVSVLMAAGAAGAASAQVVPGAPAIDWDRSRAEYTQAILGDYNELITEWRENFESGEARRSAEHYTEGAMLIVGGQPPVQGRDSIRSYLDGINATLVDIRTGLLDFVASDNLAFASGPVLYRYRDETGAIHSLTGNHVTVVTRQGRRWRIRTQVLNYVDPASAP